MPSMDKIELEIVGLTYSQTQTGAYALILGELNGKRRLPIIIGNFEAHAIAVIIEQMTPSRPLTHDLFRSFAETFNIAITEVIIYNLKEGIFYAKLVCSDEQGHEHEIDARTSDAVALAVRFSCPIYTFEFILSQSGVIFEESESDEHDEPEEITTPSKAMVNVELNEVTLDDLNDQLNKALENEDYEKASHLRDEINKRKNS